MIAKAIQIAWYRFWGKFHNFPDNFCLECGRPAYMRWEKTYNGLIGFCTYCDTNWRES